MNLHDYIPAQRIVQYLSQVDFVGVIGPTAVGKSTLIERMIERDHDIHLVRSTTSRPPRHGEQDGIDMHFKSREAMLARLDKREYVTIIPLFDNLYATAPEDYTGHGISILPMAAGAAPVFANVPFHSFRMVFVLPPSFDVWQARIAERHIDAEQLRLRMEEAVSSLEFAIAWPGMLFIMNDDLDIATESFLELLRSKAVDKEQQQACFDLAKALLAELTRRVHPAS